MGHRRSNYDSRVVFTHIIKLTHNCILLLESDRLYEITRHVHFTYIHVVSACAAYDECMYVYGWIDECVCGYLYVCICARVVAACVHMCILCICDVGYSSLQLLIGVVL